MADSQFTADSQSAVPNAKNACCRGLVASEEVDFKTVRKEPLPVIPHGLGCFATDAVAKLDKVLSHARSLTLYEVLQHSAVYELMHLQNTCRLLPFRI